MNDVAAGRPAVERSARPPGSPLDGHAAEAAAMGRNVGDEMVRSGATMTAAAQRGMEQALMPLLDLNSEMLRARGSGGT